METATETTNNVKIMTAKIDGKQIAYCSETVFLLQTGKGKDSYRTISTIKGDFNAALRAYNEYPVSGGLKKRLISPSTNIRVLARQIS